MEDSPWCRVSEGGGQSCSVSSSFPVSPWWRASQVERKPSTQPYSDPLNPFPYGQFTQRKHFLKRTPRGLCLFCYWGGPRVDSRVGRLRGSHRKAVVWRSLLSEHSTPSASGNQSRLVRHTASVNCLFPCPRALVPGGEWALDTNRRHGGCLLCILPQRVTNV